MPNLASLAVPERRRRARRRYFPDPFEFLSIVDHTALVLVANNGGSVFQKASLAVSGMFHICPLGEIYVSKFGVF